VSNPCNSAASECFNKTKSLELALLRGISRVSEYETDHKRVEICESEAWIREVEDGSILEFSVASWDENQ
jgi:hypothetical protein